MEIKDFILVNILNNTLETQKKLDEQYGEKRIENLAICFEMASCLHDKKDREDYADKIKKLFWPVNYKIDVFEKIERRHKKLCSSEGQEDE